ncbi:hypothetical protein [Pantoea sp. 18069]|uniref:hypothetical protein n=1 Tax=Pantoea sp. 18069 TaxID=2681415 RepID=UPI001F2D8240|nr:hypothetical protein [Pantoea sp. 18069]
MNSNLDDIHPHAAQHTGNSWLADFQRISKFLTGAKATAEQHADSGGMRVGSDLHGVANRKMNSVLNNSNTSYASMLPASARFRRQLAYEMGRSDGRLLAAHAEAPMQAPGAANDT